MSLRGALPKSPHLRKAVVANSTHDDDLKKELRYLEGQRKGAINNLMSKKLKFIERSKNLPQIRIAHTGPGKESERNMAESRPTTAAEKEYINGGNQLTYDFAKERGGGTTTPKIDQRSIDWCSFSRDGTLYLETGQSSRANSPFVAGDECSQASQQEQVNAKAPGSRTGRNTPFSPSPSSSRLEESMKMQELCALVALKRARSSLNVPSGTRAQMSRSLPSSPLLQKRPLKGSSPAGDRTLHKGLEVEKQVEIDSEMFSPREPASPRLTRTRAYTVDSSTTNHRRGGATRALVRLPDILGPRNSLPEVIPPKSVQPRVRSRTVNDGESHGVFRRMKSLELCPSSSKEDRKEKERRTGCVQTREVWTEEAITETVPAEETLSDDQRCENKEEEISPEEMIEKVRYTRYLRLGQKSPEDGFIPSHLMSRNLIIGHTKLPLNQSPQDTSEDEGNEDTDESCEDKPDTQDEQVEQEKLVEQAQDEDSEWMLSVKLFS